MTLPVFLDSSNRGQLCRQGAILAATNGTNVYQLLPNDALAIFDALQQLSPTSSCHVLLKIGCNLNHLQVILGFQSDIILSNRILPPMSGARFSSTFQTSKPPRRLSATT